MSRVHSGHSSKKCINTHFPRIFHVLLEPCLLYAPHSVPILPLTRGFKIFSRHIPCIPHLKHPLRSCAVTTAVISQSRIPVLGSKLEFFPSASSEGEPQLPSPATSLSHHSCTKTPEQTRHGHPAARHTHRHRSLRPYTPPRLDPVRAPLWIRRATTA